MKHTSTVAAVACALVLAAVQPTAAATIYLKLDGIPGEVTNQRHANEIAVLDFQVEVAAPRDLATGQATGRRHFSPLTITKRLDQASPKLMLACLEGKHTKSATLSLNRTTPNGTEEEYLRLTLTEVGFNSFRIAPPATPGSAGDLVEEVGLTFSKIEWTTFVGGKPMTTGWDQAANKVTASALTPDATPELRRVQPAAVDAARSHG